MLKPKINTMKELSAAIGISRPTLSRYFQDPSSVKPATSKKIEERLSKVDYVYNFIATRQNRERTGLIGVIIPHFNAPFFTSLLEVIDTAAREEGLTIIAQSSHGDAEQEANAVGKLRSMNVDGALIAPLGADSLKDSFHAASKDFPIVFMDSRLGGDIDNSDFVGTDTVQSIGSIVGYLCRVADVPIYFGIPHLNSSAIERELAYTNALTALGQMPTLVDHCGIRTSDLEALGFSVMDYHFSQQTHTADTILCANDRIAIGAIRAANRHGLMVQGPHSRGRLRIAGHDDHPLSKYMSPALTTMEQDIGAIGKDAVRLLLDRAYGICDDRQPVTILKQAKLRIRESA